MKYKVTIQREGSPNETKVIEAASRFEVYDEVHRSGGIVTALSQKGGESGLRKLLSIQIGSGVSQDEVVAMAKNLAAMLGAGLSLSRALTVIEGQAKGRRLAPVARSVNDAVIKGSSLHEALAQHPNIFSPLFAAMVRSGEESGSLSGSLSTVAVQMERSLALVRKIRGAMIYPAIVVVAIVVVAILMLVFVVPTLSETFKSLGVELPLSTRIIVGTSDFLATNAFLTLAGVIAFFAAFALFARSTKGGALIVRAALRLPVVGDIVRETYAARTARTLSSLLAAGVPLLQALEITRDVVGTPVFGVVVDAAHAYVKRGEPLARAFTEHSGLYPLLFTDMLAVGEETGKEADMLKQVSTFYEDQVEQKTKDLSSIIEPVLMLFIGAFVGIFALSVIAPIYSLSSVID